MIQKMILIVFEKLLQTNFIADDTRRNNDYRYMFLIGLFFIIDF
jgi:hypothetical protein